MIKEDFKHLVHLEWKDFDLDLSISIMVQLLNNIQSLKPKVEDWAMERLSNRGKKLKEVEAQLSEIFEKDNGTF